nr:PREDICTED: uncharacterized protein LOC109041146 [Bemisia tabaci]
MPYVAIADSAFPLGMRLMKPYDYHSPTPLQKLFNKSLSKARCVVENAFGILANRMQIFLSTISSNNPDYVELVIWASCILHNFMMDKAPQTYGVLDPEDVVNLLDYVFRALARMDTGTNIRLEFVRFFGVPF